MADELVNPYDVKPDPEPVNPNAPLINPYAVAPVVDPEYTESETAASRLENLPSFGPGSVAAQADFLGALTTGIAAPIAAGVAGWTGKALGGDDKGDAWYDKTKEALTYEPQSQEGAQAMQGVGEVMGAVEKGAKYVGSGYAALGGAAGAIAHGNFSDVPEAMGRAKQTFLETPNAMAEGTFEVTGSPAAATIAPLLPELASLGLVKPSMAPRTRLKDVYSDAPANNVMRQGDVPEGYGGIGEAADNPNWSRAGGDDIDPQAFTDLQKAVQAKNVDRVAEIINANPAIVAAFDELGIAYMPQMVSESAAVRYTASGLKSSQPTLAAVDEVVGKQLKGFADELVNKYGTTDRMMVEQGVREAFETDIATLDAGITQIYDDVLNNIPQGHQVDGTALRGYIEKRVVDELGGGNLDKGLNSRALSKHERDLWEMTHKRTEIDGKPAWEADSPTYAEIDAYRRDVGEALNGQGPYGNNRVGEVKKTYAELAKTQQRAAKDVGPDVGQAYKEANQLGQVMHDLQARSQTALGRNMDAGLITKIDTAANAIVKGNTAGFKKLIEAVPESQRQTVAMSVLDRVMTGSAGSEVITEVFLKNMTLLNRNPSARNLLFKYLPDEAVRRYKVIEQASKGFLRALAKDNKSNTALGNAVREAWASGNVWNKLTGKDGLLGHKGPFYGDWVKKLTEDGPTKRVAAAEQFLTSPALEKAARLYAQGKMRQAENAAARSAAYNRWFATLPKRTKQKVQSEGVVAFLFTSQVEGEE